MTKFKFSDKTLVACMAVLSLALTAFVAVASFNVRFAEFGASSAGTVEYVKDQSLTYDSFNNAYELKSLERIAENAGQVARDIAEGNGDVASSTLEGYAIDLRLTAIVVMDAQGSLVGEYCADGVGFQALHATLSQQAVIDVAAYPEKVYTTRVRSDDGSYTDIGCASRLDAQGIVVSIYHTRAEFANHYSLTLQSMLAGYSAENNGSVVIEDNGDLVASNVSADVDGAVSISDEDASVVRAIKERCEVGDMKVVRADGAFYLGSYGKARDCYVYTFRKASDVFHYAAANAAFVLVLCCVATLLLVAIRRRAEHAHLSAMVRQEHEYAQRLEEAAHLAQSANTAKTQFLQRMSHDVRTPINGIRGMVEVGNAYPDDVEKQRECRDKIWMASGLLLDLVNEVLDMSKLESGEVELDIQPVNLVALQSDVCEMVERQARARCIEIVRDFDGLEHPFVFASSLHVKRLLMNIASNAVKYNKTDGTVRMTCREVAFDGKQATYEFTIADTGIGMSEEFQKHLFEPFAREGQEQDNKPSGTGLGMVITKQLVETMGGTLSFESQLGQGTTYTVRLAFDVDADGARRHAEAKREAPVSLEGMRIMLVEDNELNREIAEFVIGQSGAHVTSVCDGESALETFEAQPEWAFDVILMDIMMPGMDGCQTARAIRSLKRSDAKAVPIIAMSANAFADDRRRSREAGMNDHLAKPLNSAELIDALGKIAKRS